MSNTPSNGSGGPWGGEGGRGGPKNPWGPPPRPPERDGGRDEQPRPGSSTPDFDAFIRRSQKRLRQSLGPQSGGVRPETNIPWAYIAGGLAALWLVFTSFYRVGPQERAVVQRFGRYIETTGSGMHLKFPAPIDTVTRKAVESINSTNIGAGDDGAENLILTGDQNILNMAYTVRWKISDPVRFMFELAAPEPTVREVAESAMRAEVGRVTLNEAIGPQRAQIADAVRNRMQELLTAYNSGIEVVGVDIRQADPPAAVDEAFKQVTVAQQQAQKYQNDARAAAQGTLARAQGDTAVFDALYAQYKLAPAVTRRRLYYETMEEVLGKNTTTVIETKNAAPYLPLPAARATAADAPIAVTAPPAAGVRK